jgi:hypothetical protein
MGYKKIHRHSNATSTETLAIPRQEKKWLWRLPGGIVEPLFDLAKHTPHTRKNVGRREGRVEPRDAGLEGELGALEEDAG